MPGWSDILGFGASLFGAGDRREAQNRQWEQQQEAIRQQSSLQQQALQMQKDALTPLLNAFQGIGLPGYQAGLKGLMSSYGFRPKVTPGTVNPAAGTSLGQPPTAPDQFTVVRPELGMTRTRRTGPNYVNGVDQKYVDEFGGGNAGQLQGGQIDAYNAARQKEVEQRAAEEKAWNDYQNAQNAQQFEGDWGYYGEAGRALGGITDKYTTAKQALQKRAETEGLPPALVEAAMNRLDMAEAEENRNLQLDALRQGPMALLNAISPAFGMGATGAQIASGNAGNTIQAAQQIGTNMLAASQSQAPQDSSQAYQQLGYALGQLFSPKPVTAQTTANPLSILMQGYAADRLGLPSTLPIVPKATMVNPTVPVVQQTSGLPYVGGPAYTLDDAARRAASLWGFNYTPTAYAQ